MEIGEERKEKWKTTSIEESLKRMETRLEARIGSMMSGLQPRHGASRGNLQRQDFLAAAIRLPDGDP